MFKRLLQWVRTNYYKMINSIAFYPAIISIGFLILSVLMLQFDYSEMGKTLKSNLKWLTLKDASTARSIASATTAGILSLTVFSFSMVMIVLNQAASQMSNRMLGSMIGNRFQQFVLGVYIGSIVYSLFLLSNIRDIDSGLTIPALSIYLLLLITVADIFIFIYFLHYVTQSVKFETIIKRVHLKTLTSLKNHCTDKMNHDLLPTLSAGQPIYLSASGYFQGFDKKELSEFACRHAGVAVFLHLPGSYLLKGTVFLQFQASKELSGKEIKEMLTAIDFYNGQAIEVNPHYGFHQLAEVAIKALSPGINDPQTAVLALHALADLFEYKLHYSTQTVFKDARGGKRIEMKEWSFEVLFKECFYPIWDYGKTDRYIQNSFQSIITQLLERDTHKRWTNLLTSFLNVVQRDIGNNTL